MAANQNVSVIEKDGKLTLVIDLAKVNGPTGKGKNMSIASTGRGLTLATAVGPVTIALNAYRPAKGNAEIEACAIQALNAAALENAAKERDAALQAAMARVNSAK